MELFPAQPDLSLQISPPNTKKPTSSWKRREQEEEEDDDLGFWKRALDSRHSSLSNMAQQPDDSFFELSLSNPTPSEPISNQFNPFDDQNNHHSLHHYQQSPPQLFQIHQQQQQQQQQYGLSPELRFLRPIRGIPVYQNYPPPFPIFAQHPLLDISHVPSCTNGTSTATSTTSPSNYFQSQGAIRSRFLSRFPAAKRSMRAPRMRWTTTLHARFIHAVELLGGHERATPKSVLELMDVKDLTLAHVKSHLQMYRTVKTTDRAAASSGQSEVYDNGSSGDTSEDMMFDIQNTRSRSELSIQEGIRPILHHENKDYDHGLWSNSSREAWLHGKPRDCGGNISFLEKEMDPKSLIADLSETSPKKPNLEFTLGTPH